MKKKVVIYNVLLGVICFTMMILSLKFGPSNDEWFQVPYGEQSLDYYVSFGENDSVLDYKPEPLMKNYGALIDMVPEAITRVLGTDLMSTRHMFIAFFSFFYIFFGSLIAKRIGGNTAGFIAIALLVILPRVFGEAMNNPKDPTFAASYLCSIWSFMYFFDSLPKPSKKSYLVLFLGFMSMMFVRVSGLMCGAYFLLFAFLEWYTRFRKDKEFKINGIALKVILAGLLGYFSSIFFWPSMFNNPIWQPLDALQMLKQYPITLRNLWEGGYIQSNTIPWYYNLKYFLMTNPEITLIGIVLGFVLIVGIVKKYNRNRVMLLLFSSLFPLCYIIYSKTALLTGWRHSYFIFVPLVVFAAIAFGYIHDYLLKKKVKKIVFLGLISLALLPPLFFMVKHTPYFYVYFNHASGGMKKALGNYELDYYSHSEKPATDWLMENVPDFENLNLVSNNPYAVSEIFKTNKIDKPVRYVRYRERYNTDWDYAIFTHSFVDADYLKNGKFPPKGTVKTIEANGVAICAIIKRENRDDLYGKLALDSNNFTGGIELLSKAVKYDPNNEIAWTNLGLAFLKTGQYKKSIECLTYALSVYPESTNAKNFLGYAYLNSGNMNLAEYTFLEIIEDSPNYAEPYNILSQIYKQKGDLQSSEKYMNYYKQLSAQSK